MSSSSPRKRLTVIASAQGVEKAETTLIRLGFDSKTNLAKAQFLSRTAVTKFFNQQPIQSDTFKRICEGLKLDWKEILDSESNAEIGQPEVPEVVEMSARGHLRIREKSYAKDL